LAALRVVSVHQEVTLVGARAVQRILSPVAILGPSSDARVRYTNRWKLAVERISVISALVVTSPRDPLSVLSAGSASFTVTLWSRRVAPKGEEATDNIR